MTFRLIYPTYYRIAGVQGLSLLCKCIILICALLFLNFCGLSQVNAISLQEAKEEALRNNLNIKIAKDKILERQAESRGQFAAMLPKLTLESFASHSENKAAVIIKKGSYGTYYSFPFPQNDVEIETGRKDNLMIGLKLEQPVFTGGKLYYSYKTAKVREEWTEWNDKQVVLEEIRKVEEAYFNVLKAEENKKFAEKHRTTLNAHLADVEIQYQNGRIALHEVLKVKLEVARSNELMTKANNALLVARARFNTVLNYPIDQPVDITKEEDPLPITITIEDAEKIAMSNHPSLNRAHARIKEAEYNRKISAADYYPDFLFTAGYYQRTEQPVYPETNWHVMLNMTWPFWEWGKTGHKINASKSIERQSAYAILDLENQIKAEIRQAWLQSTESYARIEVTKEAMKYADENLRITQIGYEKGINTSTSVLQAEEILLRTQADYITAKYEAHYAGTLLRYSIGIMSFEDLYQETQSSEKK